jgi:BCL2/adenovirus E1B protein-interacting protein 3
MEPRNDIDTRNERLNESWIECGTAAAAGEELTSDKLQQSVHSVSPSQASSLVNSSVERLLLEAQKESSCASSLYLNSRESSQESPKSVHSPASELNANNDAADVSSQVSNEAASATAATNWVLNWSSRPEIVPPSDRTASVLHDAGHAVAPRRHRLSIRNTCVMRGILFVVENFPVLLVTHACSFILGAVTVVVYLKKYRRWSPVPLSVVDG